MALEPAAVRDEPFITPIPKQHSTHPNNPDSRNNPPVDDPSNVGDVIPSPEDCGKTNMKR
jgi:hypothetical protein